MTTQQVAVTHDDFRSKYRLYRSDPNLQATHALHPAAARRGPRADETGFPTDEITRGLLHSINPNHLRFFESERHGYVTARVDPGGLRAQFRSPRTVLSRTSPATDVLAEFHVPAGTQRLDRT